VLRPRVFDPHDGPAVPGRREHLQLLEQYSETDLANLLSFLGRA